MPIRTDIYNEVEIGNEVTFADFPTEVIYETINYICANCVCGKLLTISWEECKKNNDEIFFDDSYLLADNEQKNTKLMF